MRRKVEQIGEKELVFKALCDGGRLQILRLLQKEELNATQILEQVDLVQSTLSHHMKVLTDAGILTTRRAGKATYYRINTERVREIIGWGEAFLSEYGEESAPKKTVKTSAPKNAVLKKAEPEQETEPVIDDVIEPIRPVDETKPEKPKKDKAKKKDKKEKKNKKDKKEKKSKKEKKEKK